MLATSLHLFSFSWTKFSLSTSSSPALADSSSEQTPLSPAPAAGCYTCPAPAPAGHSSNRSQQSTLQYFVFGLSVEAQVYQISLIQLLSHSSLPSTDQPPPSSCPAPASSCAPPLLGQGCYFPAVLAAV